MEFLKVNNIVPTDKIKVKRIWWLNIGCEKYWDTNKKIKKGIVNDFEYKITTSMETLLFLVAKTGDIVILNQISNNIIKKILKLTKQKIKILILNSDEKIFFSQKILNDKIILDYLSNIKNKEDYLLMPFGVTKFDVEIEKITGIKLYMTNNLKIISMMNNKIFSRNLSKKLLFSFPKGYILNNKKNIDYISEKFKDRKNFIPCVLKETHGSSGKGLYIIDTNKKFKQYLNFIKRKEERVYILEEWYKTKLDFNYQIYINEAGQLYRSAIKTQILKNGVYIGGYDLSQEREQSEFGNKMNDYILEIGNFLFKFGYWGLISIDAILDIDGNIMPLIEINARFSLSSYFSLAMIEIENSKLKYYKYYKIKSGISLEKIEKELSENVIICSYYKGENEFEYGRIFLLFLVKRLEEVIDIEKKIKKYIIT